jgi:hypothetical protein
VTAISTVPAKAHLVLDGTRFELLSANISYPEGDLNVADCQLALGYLTARGTGETAQLDYPRFTPAQIEVDSAVVYSTGDISATGASGPYTLFNGLLDDVGPSSVGVGKFVINVRLLGRLAGLHAGSMQSSSVLANQYADLTYPIENSLGSTALLELARTDTGVATGEALLDALIKITGTSLISRRTAASVLLQEYFGAEFGNTTVRPILEEIRDNGASDLVIDGPEGFDVAIAIVMDKLLRNDIDGRSFFNTFQHLGSVFGFRLLETTDAIRIIPFTPFVNSADCLSIDPDSYVIVDRLVNSTQQCSGVALANGSTDATADAPYTGIYARPGGYGQLAIQPAPAYLATSRMSNYASDGTPANDGTPLIPASDVRETIGVAAAREACLMANYGDRYYTVVCPFVRLDLSPCSPVVINYPSLYANIGSFSSAIYGAVKLVNINIDANGSVTTTITVGYARTSSQQESEIDTAERAHPIWATTFTGQRI